MRIRLTGLRALVGVALAACFAGSASAGVVKLSDSLVGTNGGPFTATVLDGPIGKYSMGQSFNTFCVEVNEEFYPNPPYPNTYYTVVSDRSVEGTGSTLQQPGPPPFVLLSPDVAYLYTNFMAGDTNMKNNVYSSWTGSSTDKQSLQNAIWHLMGYSYTASGNSAEETDLLSAATLAHWTNIGDVRVMQMWNYYDSTTGVYSGVAQDQLVMTVPTPKASVAGLGLLSSLALVGWIKGRRDMKFA